MKIKICGMKYRNNITEVAAMEPDYLGFIFYKNSKRFFTGVIPPLKPSIKKVGVFVDSKHSEILNAISEHKLNAIQLHGNESVEFCKILKQSLKSIDHSEIEIIKAFSIDDSFEFDILIPYEDHCNYFLFDTKGKLPGGNGYTFDWKILEHNTSNKPFFLSGGIGLDCIEKLQGFLTSEASRYCEVIDLNSKMELKPGLKDPELLREFKKRVKHFYQQ